MEKNRHTAREEWVDMDIEVETVDEDALKFVASEKLEKDRVSACADTIVEWLEEEQLLTFRSKTAVIISANEGFDQATFYRALKLLRQQQKIDKTKGRGTYINLSTAQQKLYTNKS